MVTTCQTEENNRIASTSLVAYVRSLRDVENQLVDKGCSNAQHNGVDDASNASQAEETLQGQGSQKTMQYTCNVLQVPVIIAVLAIASFAVIGQRSCRCVTLDCL